MFNWIIGIPLFTLFASVALTVSVVPTSRHENSRWTLKAMLILVVLWAFTSLMLHSISVPSTLFWLDFLLLLGGPIFAVGVHFCADFTRSTGAIVNSAKWIAYLVALLLVITTIAGKMTSSAVLLSDGAVDIEFGPFTPAMWGTIPLIIMSALTILISSLIKSPHDRGRHTILPIVGYILVLFGVLSNIFVSRYPIDVASGFAFVLILSYSVTSRHILRPAVPESRWISVPGITLIFFVCYAGMFVYSYEWLGLTSYTSHVAAALVSFVIFFTTYEPLRSFVTHRLNRYIFPYSQRYYQALSSLLEVDPSLTKWVDNTMKILKTMVETTKADDATLLIWDADHHRFDTKYSSGNIGSNLFPSGLEIDSPVIKALNEKRGSLTFADMAGQAENDVQALEWANLQKTSANMLFCGLYGYEGLIGIIVATKDLSKDWNRTEDRDFIELVCQQITPIIENSLLYLSLQRSEERYRVLVENAGDYIFMLDKELRVLSVNQSAANFLRDEQETLIGKSVTELFPDEIAARYSRNLRKVFDTGRTLVEQSQLQLGGEEVYLDTVLSPIKDNEGRVMAIIGVSRDISERKQAELREARLLEQLHLANRLSTVGEMAAGVAHEVNNPLTAVIISSDWLLGMKLPDEVRKDVEIISNGAQRAADILERMLTFTTQRNVVKEYLDIAQVLDIAIEFRSHSLSRNNIDVAREFTDNLPKTMANGVQLQEVFLNLIMNAEAEMKEAHGKGTLTIRTELVDDNIKISFMDDGRGIEEKNLDKLFNPFFTTKEVGKGTGIGLSVCYSIISEHGGKIYAENTPGKGATFVIELPVAAMSSYEPKDG